MSDPTTQTVVYTAPGLDGAVHLVTAVNTVWSVSVARQYAAMNEHSRLGHLPCDVNDIEILNIRDPGDDEEVGFDE